MTMNFRTIKDNLVTILGAAAAGQYLVAGYRSQDRAAVPLRLVQVFWSGNTMPDNQAGLTGTFEADTTYTLELQTSATATGDVTALENDASSDGDRATALAEILTAAQNADAQFDELVELITQALLDGTNVDAGTTGPPFIISGRWLPISVKDPVKTEGQHVTVTGRIMYNCLIQETVEGVTPTPAVAPALDVTDDLDGDDNEKTGSIT